jgi:hypothetical protein
MSPNAGGGAAMLDSQPTSTPVHIKVQQILETEEHRPFDRCKIEIFRHIYKIHFLIFFSLFCTFDFKFKKIANMTNKKFCEKIKTDIKNAEFHADFKSLEKVVKKCTKKAKHVGQTRVKVQK